MFFLYDTLQKQSTGSLNNIFNKQPGFSTNLFATGKINPTKKKIKKHKPDKIFRDLLIPSLESIGFKRFSSDCFLSQLFEQPSGGTYSEEYLMVRAKTTGGAVIEFAFENNDLEARWPGHCLQLRLDKNFENHLVDAVQRADLKT